MKAEVFIREAQGRLKAPSSKSAVQRYIAGALLAGGVSKIFISSMCDDSLSALSVASALGAEITASGDTIIIKGGFKPKTNKINCGESGLSARMFIPIAAIHNSEITITGRGSLMNRPVNMVEKPLMQLGVTVSTRNGYLPVKIKGPLSGGDVNADGSMSSQFITGLLMALPVAVKKSRLFVDNLVSRPYIDLTVKILNEFGIEIINNDYKVFNIKGKQKYIPGNFVAEGDWSGSAFLLVLGAVGGNVEITGLDYGSVQADKAIIDALLQANAPVKTDRKKISASRGELKCFEFDLTNCPDLAPPLAVLALACRGRTILKGTQRLIAKESNRAETITKSLRAIGARIMNHHDFIEIEGGTQIEGGIAQAFNDHRIAMALAAASMISAKPVIIDGFECINKSYPGFVDDFKMLGGKFRILK